MKNWLCLKPQENILEGDQQHKDLAEDNDNVRVDPNYEASCSSGEPHLLLTQGVLSDLLRYLNLSEKEAQLLSPQHFFLQNRRKYVFLEIGMMTKNFFVFEEGLVFCNNVMFCL